MERWVNKVAVVTGASSGIGAAIAELLVEDGMKVVGLARRELKLEELKKKLEYKKGKFFSIKADLTVEEDIISAFQWTETNLGPIHVLVNNAGRAMKLGFLEATDTETWRQLYNLNVLGLQICCREALQSMRRHNIDDGHIINISSLAAHMSSPAPAIVPYFASKKAVNTISEGLRVELGVTKSKIKVSNISPGMVKTDIFENAGIKIPNNVSGLESLDVAKSVQFILQQPPNVLISELVLRHVIDSSEDVKNINSRI